MNLLSKTIKLLSILLCVWAFIGCQSFQPKHSGELALKNHDFLDLWESYNSCLTSRDLNSIRESLLALDAAPRPISLEDSPIPVPKFLKNLSTHRSSRLAVDPRAMSASCSIHLAETAKQSNDWNTALLTLKEVLKDYPEARYTYYTTKAQMALEQFHTTLPASLSSQDLLVR